MFPGKKPFQGFFAFWKISLFPVLFSILITMGGTGRGLAQEFDVLRAQPMPQVAAVPADVFQKETKPYQETPAGDANLAYRLRLPVTWEKSLDAGLGELKISKAVLGEVVRFYGPPLLDKRSSFSIQALQIDYEISAKNWFTDFILSNGYTLEGMNVISDTMVEAIYVYIEKDISYVSRAVAQVMGNRVVLAQYFVPYDFWAEEKVMQAACLSSFVLTNPDRRATEIMDTYVFLDLIEFEYPISWAARASAVNTLDRMGTTLISTSDLKTLNGQIDVQIISRKKDSFSISDEVRKLRDRIARKSAFRVGERIEMIPSFLFKPEVRAATIEAFMGTSEEDYERLIGYEIWSGVLVEDEYYYLIAMLTPARNNDFLRWARNAKAFERVAESIHSEVTEKDPGALARRERERRRREEAVTLEQPDWDLSPEKLIAKKKREKRQSPGSEDRLDPDYESSQ